VSSISVFATFMGHFGPMSYRTTVLTQVLGGLDAKEFSRCAARHPLRHAPSAISAYYHFATTVFV
jgi:hypothetical protein